ncbi:MAG TPA: polyprenyl synthetase family protein [Pirellulales bacterium]|jgi:octaprenyl-diphosphate synthase|nr:polyprenyl synthetase family protein [Pirellulales bacterium]
MAPVLTQREVVRRKLKSLYAPVAAELEQVEQLLRAELRNEHPCVDELAQHAFRLGGKRLRPALVLLTAQACGNLQPDHIVLAAVVEMVHTATLVHDDILDEATLRRHLETVNSRWGNKSSVLLGDYLFTHAFYLASTLSSTFACRKIGRATNVVCEGELRQIHTQACFDLTEADYLSIIDAKTAELCACCCALGAHYSGANQAATAALEQFGRNLGIAFQIADDLLDVWGDEAQVGKSLGTDLEQQKPTLPLIRLLTELPGPERAAVVAALKSPATQRREFLAPYLARTDALAYAHQKAAAFAALALQQLDCLPFSPAKLLLENLTEFVVTRRD